MLLFIDSDLNSTTGWQGYDYLINFPTIDSTHTTIKQSTGGWNWSQIGSTAFARSGNQMEMRIPRALIGQLGSDVSFDFHWADNIQKTDDIIEFSVSGDNAPDRRFNYRYNPDFTPPDLVSNLRIAHPVSGHHLLDRPALRRPQQYDHSVSHRWLPGGSQ